LFQADSLCSSIYHTRKHAGTPQTPPLIRLPPPSLPNYLTSSSGFKCGSSHVVKKKRQAEDDGEAKEKAAELRGRVLGSKPGSFDAQELFKTLPKEIASIVPDVKDQRRFVTNLCKAAWYKSQGGVLFSLCVWPCDS